MSEQRVGGFKFSAGAVITQKLDYKVLEGDLCVFRLANTIKFEESVSKNFERMYKPSKFSGFAKFQDVEAFILNQTDSIAQLNNLSYVHPDFCSYAQRLGFSAAWDKYGLNQGLDVYELFEGGQGSLDQLVDAQIGSYMLFDRNGVVLPTAIHFDYMDGLMNDGHYDINKAIELLKNDPRIVPQSIKRGGDAQDLIKLDVPYYNAEEGCNHYLRFKFAPTKEDMMSLWEKMKSYGTSYPSTEGHRAIFDLDMLGLKAYGAAKTSTYYA